VKSNFGLFQKVKTAVLAILEALNFDFGKIAHLQMSKNHKNSKFRSAGMVKMAVLDL